MGQGVWKHTLSRGPVSRCFSRKVILGRLAGAGGRWLGSGGKGGKRNPGEHSAFLTPQVGPKCKGPDPSTPRPGMSLENALGLGRCSMLK